MKKLLFTCLLITQAALHTGMANPILVESSVPLNQWTARNPGVVTVENDGSQLRLSFGKFPERWQVVDGPEIPVPARSEFFKHRRCWVSMEVKTAGLEGYTMMQIRIRQRAGTQKEGGAFTRNIAPRLEWEAAAELDHAHKYRTWAHLESVSTLYPTTERLALEIWVASPGDAGPAKVDIRNFKIAEMAELEHTISSVPKVEGNLFFSTSGGIKVDFVDPDKVKACRIELFDEAGDPLGKVEGEAGTKSLKIPLPSIGYYRVQATADYLDKSSITAGTTAAVLGEPLDESVRKNSRLGAFRVWGDQDLWLKSGANWDWGIGGVNLADYVLNPDGSISPPAGAKPLSYPDTHKNIYTIGAFPKWVMPEGYSADSLMAPKDWELFERLIETFARHNPGLPWFCSYNEPDAHWRGSAEDFVKFHKAIAAGVKKGNPKMKFYGPCMYSIRMDDLRKYDAMGLLDCLDGLVMHAYVDGSEPEGEFIKRAAEMIQFLKETGRGEMPVFITEFGWCAEIGDWQKTITELERSQYAPRSMALMAALPVDAVEYFVFKHVSKPGKPGYSLLYSDNTPTPTYVAFVNLLKWLSWTQRGQGRWFGFSPSLHLTLFQGEDRSTGVAWNTSGESKLTLPVVPLRMSDSMGRMLSVDGPTLAVGPAPVFFDLPPIDGLFDAATLPKISVAPSESIPLPWTNVLAAPEITIGDNTAKVAPNASPGEYLILGKVNDVFQAQPVRVLAPLEVSSLDFKLSPDGSQLIATATMVTPLREGAEVHWKATAADGTISNLQRRLETGSSTIIEMPVAGFMVGKRFQGKMSFTLGGRIPFEVTRKFDQTIIPTPSLEVVGWKGIPSVDISAWNPHPDKLDPQDCAASFQTAVSPQGFHLRVEVADNKHHQTQLPSYMWNGDSIQFAFDVDADKEWQPNNVGNGYKGHRIFEYGVGLHGKTPNPMVWRWRADAPGFTANSEETRLSANVKREGNTTTYDVLVPWAALGLSGAPAPKSNIGFSLVVNDLDGGTDKRKALRFGGGILESKNVEDYGKLHVIQPAK